MKESDNLELQVNANEMCRTCLSAELPPDQLKPIFCNEIVDGRIVPFPKVLELTMGFKPTRNEIFPKNVCVNCKTKLKELYSFKNKVSESEDLLYEIFNCEKPPEQKPVVAAVRPPTVTKETQTGRINVNEVEPSSYQNFLIIQKAPKVATKDAAINCIASSTVDSACQTVSFPKSMRCASVQVTAPAKLLKHCEVQANIDEELELEVLQFDVVEMMDGNETAQQLAEEQRFDDQTGLEGVAVQSEVEDFETDEELPQPVLKPVGKPAAIEERDDPSEYMSYEALEEPVSEAGSEIKTNTKEPIVETKPVSECQYCQYTTEDKAAFKEHINVHRGPTLENIFVKADYFRCIGCYSVYDSVEGLESHFNDGPCSSIGDDFIESEEVAKHEQFYSNGFDICLPRMKSFHRINKIMIACGVCNMQFKTIDEGETHFTTHEQELESQQDVDQIWEDNEFSQNHFCGICHEQFPDATFIRQHVYFHRSTHQCPLDCAERFNTFGALTEHIKRHLTSQEEQPPPSTAKSSAPMKKPKPNPTQTGELSCEICSKPFNSKASLKVHTKNHFADRRHACTMCPKTFIQKSDLTIHIRSHTDERPFSCTVPGCDKRFRTSSHRRDHMSTHAAQNTFQCQYCQKFFKAERILQGHLRLHTGLKPFECGLCGKAFSRKQHLKLHMKTHEKEKE